MVRIALRSLLNQLDTMYREKVRLLTESKRTRIATGMLADSTLACESSGRFRGFLQIRRSMIIPTQYLRTYVKQRTLALFAVATMASVPAVAMNRAPRLHAAARPAGHVVAAHAYPRESAREHGHHAARYAYAEERAPKRGKNSGASKSAPAASKSHAKESRGKHREPEYADEPVVMHRAKVHGRKLTRHEREQELAQDRREAAQEARYQAAQQARYESAHEAQRAHAAHVAMIPASQPVAVHEPDTDSARYDSREFTASFANVRRGVDQAARPNAFTRHSKDTQDTKIGSALHSDSRDGAAAGRQTTQPASDPVAEQARRSSVVVRHPAPPAQISASDAPMPAQHYQPRVVNGFGAEVAPLPSSNARNLPPGGVLATEAQDLGEDLAADALPSARTLANDATQPLVTPMYSRDGNLMMPTPLRGSHEILVHQNLMADHDGLERIHDDRELNRLRADRELVGFPESSSLRVNEALPDNRRVARPWTVKFAGDLARAFYSRFGEPITVTSAVRTVSYQLRLQRVNGNAAATRGEGASPHLTGQAIDLGKRGMTANEIGWMRTYLLPFIDAGKVDVEEEFQQACFHISVYRSYMPVSRRPAMQVAQARALPATATTNLPLDSDSDR